MSPASAQIYWDGTASTWTPVSGWSTAAGTTTPDPAAAPGAGDDVVFSIPSVTANHSIGMAGADLFAKSLTFNSTGAVTIGNGGGNRDLTVGAAGMTLASGGGTVTIGNAGSSNVIVRLGTSQTWTNHSRASMTSRNSTTGLAGFYKIVDWAGSTGFIAGDFVATNLAGGATGTFTVDSGTSTLYLTVVPEPEAAMLGGSLGLLDLLRRPRTQ